MKDISNSDDNHDEEEDAEEETISLSDFPITAGNQNDQNSTASAYHHDRQSSDFFEFFNYDLTKDISHADDIFLRGKLIPFQQQQHHHYHHQTSIKHRLCESHRMNFREDGEQRNFHHHHRRWESCSELTSSPPWNSPKAGKVRNSRSLDHYQELRRDSSVKSVGRADHSRVWKPRWYVLMFGSFRFRPEMELRDIKNRQVRRAPAATMFQPLDGEGKKPVSLTNGRKSSWCLLKALICKSNVTDDVTASVSCVPKA